MVFNCVFFFTFQCGILGQVCYLIVSIPEFCLLTYIHKCITESKNELVRSFFKVSEDQKFRYSLSALYLMKILMDNNQAYTRNQESINVL